MQSYNFCFWLFLVIGHVTIIPTCYWMNPDKQNLIFLAFWSYKITFPFGGIYRGPQHGPWRQCLIVYTLHTPTLFFSEPSTILLLKILNFFFGHIPWTWEQQFGSVQRPYKQYSTIVDTISVNTMSILFFWSYGYIFTNNHIWKCPQTMLTLLQHYQQ